MKQMWGPAQATQTRSANESHAGRPARTVFGPPEMGKRRQDQLATAADFKVFHAFRFTDRQPESGITFRHRSVEDTARTYKAVHYDHGNGLSVADVDNDGRLDVLFVTQAGGKVVAKYGGAGWRTHRQGGRRPAEPVLRRPPSCRHRQHATRPLHTGRSRGKTPVRERRRLVFATSTEHPALGTGLIVPSVSRLHNDGLLTVPHQRGRVPRKTGEASKAASTTPSTTGTATHSPAT